MIENQLADIVYKKSSKSYMNLGGTKRLFIGTYVYEHFRLDMCTYKGTEATVTDVFYTEGSRVPEILATDIVNLVERGIYSSSTDEHMTKIFEASLYCPNIPKGSSVHDLKKLLNQYSSDFYAECKGQMSLANRTARLHFYKL
jgi:hypothetical protein